MYMPALSSTMEEGTIVQWLKEVGDKIEVGGWVACWTGDVLGLIVLGDFRG